MFEAIETGVDHKGYETESKICEAGSLYTLVHKIVNNGFYSETKCILRYEGGILEYGDIHEGTFYKRGYITGPAV